MQRSTKFLGYPLLRKLALISEFQNAEFYEKSKS